MRNTNSWLLQIQRLSQAHCDQVDWTERRRHLPTAWLHRSLAKQEKDTIAELTKHLFFVLMVLSFSFSFLCVNHSFRKLKMTLKIKHQVTGAETALSKGKTGESLQALNSKTQAYCLCEEVYFNLKKIKRFI